MVFYNNNQSVAYRQVVKENESLIQKLAQHEAELALKSQTIQGLSLQLSITSSKLIEESNRSTQLESDLKEAIQSLSNLKQKLDQAPTKRILLPLRPKLAEQHFSSVQATTFSEKLNKALRIENKGLQTRIIQLQERNEKLQRHIRRCTCMNSKHPIGSIGSRNI